MKIRFLNKIGRICFPVCFAFFCHFSASHAEEKKYPFDESVKIYVPFAQGGTTDTVIRETAALLSDEINQKIEIIPPEPGQTAKDVILRAASMPANGYHLCVGNVGTHGAAPAVEGVSLRYDPTESFSPIVMLGVTPMVLMTRGDFPGNNFIQIVKHIRENPNKYSIGENGVSSTSFLAALQFSSVLKTEFNFISYSGSLVALEDLANGYLDVFIDQSISAAPYINSKLVKAALITKKLNSKQGDVFSQIPTSEDVGLGEFNVVGWNILFAPKNTPKDRIDFLNRKFLKVLDNKILTARALEAYNGRLEKDENNPEKLSIFVANQVKKWRKILGIVRNTGDVKGLGSY